MCEDCHSCRMKWLLKIAFLYKWSRHRLYSHAVLPTCISPIPVYAAVLHISNNIVSLLPPIASYCLSASFCFQFVLGQHTVLSPDAKCPSRPLLRTAALSSAWWHHTLYAFTYKIVAVFRWDHCFYLAETFEWIKNIWKKSKNAAFGSIWRAWPKFLLTVGELEGQKAVRSDEQYFCGRRSPELSCLAAVPSSFLELKHRMCILVSHCSRCMLPRDGTQYVSFGGSPRLLSRTLWFEVVCSLNV